MITIKVQTVQVAAEKYFDEHLAKGEYFTEGEEQSPAAAESENLTKYYTEQTITWQGKTAARLGLKEGEPITREQFTYLLENKHPSTGKNLTARTNKTGRRLYFDATVSAPKSVSVLAVTMGETRLLKAHQEATKEALTALEDYTQTRVRVQGQNTVRKTQNMLTATVTHTTSRANDPQLHSHNLIFNVTWDDIEQKYKAMEAYEIYNNVEYFTEFYRNKLAEKVLELGYQIERAKHGWEIKGVSKEICDLFSKRSAVIKEAEAALETSLGRPITNQERALVAEQTRQKKSKGLTLEKAVEMQKAELSPWQLRVLENTISLAKIRNEGREELLASKNKRFGLIPAIKPEKEITDSEKEAVAFAIAHIFERQSVVKKTDILALAMKTDYGKLNPKNLEKILVKTPDLIWSRDRTAVGTIDGLAKEVFISSFVAQHKTTLPELKPIPTDKLQTLREEQQQALKEIYSNLDKVMILEGGAGTGKSHLLRVLTESLKAENISVTATAPTTGATQNLNKDIGVEAQTIQRILHRPGLYAEALTNGYLIVDEAGLLSLKQMEALFMVSEKYNTQILLVGDTKQHHGVESGDALRALKTYSDIKVARLTEIARQRAPEYREAVREIQNQNLQRGWELFEQMGAIHSKADYLSQRGTALSYEDLEKKLDTEKLYQTYLKKIGEGKSVLVVTPTRQELQTLTQGIRESLKDQLGETSIQKEVFASVRFTEAEKMNLSHYLTRGNEAHYVNFIESRNGFEKGSTWRVKEIKQTQELDRGEEGLQSGQSGLGEENELGAQGPRAILENTKTQELKEFNPKEFLGHQFDIAEQKTIEIKVGERLLMQKNDRQERELPPDPIQEVKEGGEAQSLLEPIDTSLATCSQAAPNGSMAEPPENQTQQPPRKVVEKFTNGESIKVAAIEGTELILEDGRRLTESIKHLDYGYVSTSYASQGKTCDHVIVAMTNAGGRALSQEQFYVSTSRGREGIDIFIEDKEYIKSRIEALGERPFNLNLTTKDQKKWIMSLQAETLDELREKSQKIAERLAKNMRAEKSISERVIEKTKDTIIDWRDKLRAERNRQIEHHKDSLQMKIQISRATMEKGQYPLEKEPMAFPQKLMEKGKAKEIDFEP